LILGSAAEPPAGGGLGGLDGADLGMDSALEALYESDRKGSLGSSCPNVARWLGDIRQYFPSRLQMVFPCGHTVASRPQSSPPKKKPSSTPCGQAAVYPYFRPTLCWKKTP
jgi:hypothetical protein